MRKLINAQTPGRALDSTFYRDSEIFRHDMETVFFRHWIYAGHSAELPQVGCYFLFEVGEESIIVARTKTGMRAFANVCRHRGSRICDKTSGKVAAFVCPYHAWTYSLDGKLRAPRDMPADFAAAEYSLKTVHCAVFHGMIFINLNKNAPDLENELACLNESLRVYELENAKVAHREKYLINANWKLALENFMECYHCAPAHADYAKCHALASKKDCAAMQPAMLRDAEKLGYQTQTIGNDAPASRIVPHYYARHPLYPPYQTGSEDGRPLAPLLGKIRGYGGGVADVQFGPVSFGLLYADHAVLYRIVARDVQATEMTVVWLVNAAAEEARDYDRMRLTWLWRVTSDADKKIVTENQKGVNSRFYSPGVLSAAEEFVEDFIRWYLSEIGASKLT